MEIKCGTLDWFIDELKENQVFVFGSNLAGKHGGGAAKNALKFGAEWGKADGMQGRSYGIPTVSHDIQSMLSVQRIKIYVDRFISYATQHPELEFLVTEIGCGLAHYEHSDIAPLFEKALYLENVYLPQRFIECLKGL